MTPEEFAQLQRQIADQIGVQNKLLSAIRTDIRFLAWVIAIALLMLLGVALK